MKRRHRPFVFTWCVAAFVLCTLYNSALERRVAHEPVRSRGHVTRVRADYGLLDSTEAESHPIRNEASFGATSGSDIDGDPPSSSKPAEIVFMMYSDHVNEGLCAAVDTAVAVKIDLRIVGLDHDEFDMQAVRNVKTKKLHAFLKILNEQELRDRYGITSDETIVSLTDANDVLYAQSAENVLASYRNLTRRVSPERALVVVAAERNCWPYMDGDQELQRGGREYCKKFEMKARGSSYKYLNSGGLMGPAHAMAALYRDVRSMMQSVNDDDQQVIKSAYAKQIDNKASPMYTIALDHGAEIFQTGWHTHLETVKYAEPERNGAYYDAARGLVVNTEHNTTPSIVHFNGGKVAFVSIARDVVRRALNDDYKGAYNATRRLVYARSPQLERNCSLGSASN